MKAKEILEWICRESISGEFLNFVDVPEEGNECWEQNEEWWNNAFGACPPHPIEAGKYLYFYDSSIEEYRDCGEYDAQIEIPQTYGGFDYIYLYKVED